MSFTGVSPRSRESMSVKSSFPAHKDLFSQKIRSPAEVEAILTRHAGSKISYLGRGGFGFVLKFEGSDFPPFAIKMASTIAGGLSVWGEPLLGTWFYGKGEWKEHAYTGGNVPEGRDGELGDKKDDKLLNVIDYKAAYYVNLQQWERLSRQIRASIPEMAEILDPIEEKFARVALADPDPERYAGLMMIMEAAESDASNLMRKQMSPTNFAHLAITVVAHVLFTTWKLREWVGFIHGDLKLPNVLYRTFKEPLVLTYNSPTDPQIKFEFTSRYLFMLTDLGFSYLQNTEALQALGIRDPRGLIFKRGKSMKLFSDLDAQYVYPAQAHSMTFGSDLHTFGMTVLKMMIIVNFSETPKDEDLEDMLGMAQFCVERLLYSEEGLANVTSRTHAEEDPFRMNFRIFLRAFKKRIISAVETGLWIKLLGAIGSITEDKGGRSHKIIDHLMYLPKEIVIAASLRSTEHFWDDSIFREARVHVQSAEEEAEEEVPKVGKRKAQEVKVAPTEKKPRAARLSDLRATEKSLSPTPTW